jgi:hypothetical protein
MVDADTLMRDILFFIKNDFTSNITDPIAGKRTAQSAFVMTSYPQRDVQYPIITIRITNVNALRAGMQTQNMDYTITVEIRIWARNQKEKDTLYNNALERLRTIQYTASTGSVANNLHDFNAISAVEVDEDGAGRPKSRVFEVTYSFFN